MKYLRIFATEDAMNNFQPDYSVLKGNKENNKIDIHKYTQPVDATYEIHYKCNDEDIRCPTMGSGKVGDTFEFSAPYISDYYAKDYIYDYYFTLENTTNNFTITYIYIRE